MNIEEAAEKYANDHPLAVGRPMLSILKSAFEAGAKSDAAKQFKSEQKQAIVGNGKNPINEAAEKYFYTHCQIFQGVHAGEYLDKEDFMKYAKQFKAEQKQAIVTDLPAPPWDDSVTHNLELVSTNEKA